MNQQQNVAEQQNIQSGSETQPAFRTTIEPRFCETDAFGHIGNTVLPTWFEHARKPIFQEISKSFSKEKWPTIIAHASYDFINQIFIESNVDIDISISHIGNKSFTVHHDAWQNNTKVAEGKTVIVWFDHSDQQTKPIPDEVRQRLQKFVIK
ncbi:1,4-dihydroxy-2-naphthoyl-CoA hydrolase [Thalassocella blandensis]|nr:1,4-dihydroxy-2-naphthoyl-CoA hydrolase [Thalassocella blandensis]